jgi:hypothetical protein
LALPDASCAGLTHSRSKNGVALLAYGIPLRDALPS